MLLDRGSQTKSVLIKSRSSENEGPFSCTDSNKRVPVPLVFRKKQMECQAFVCNLWRHFTYGLKILCLRATLEAWRLRLWRRGKSDFVQAAKMKAIVFRKHENFVFFFCFFLTKINVLPNSKHIQRHRAFNLQRNKNVHNYHGGQTFVLCWTPLGREDI